MIKRLVCDAGNAAGKRDTGQVDATIKCISPDAAGGNDNLVQIAAIGEGIISNVGNAAGSRDAG